MTREVSAGKSKGDPGKWLIALLAAFFAIGPLWFIFAPALTASSGSFDYGWMVGGPGGWAGIGSVTVLMMFLPLAFLAALQVLAGHPPRESPLASRLAPDRIFPVTRRPAQG